MNEFKLPESLNEEDKRAFLRQLENLIAQTYNVEKEYVALRNAYNGLQELIRQIIEALPNALWVLNEDGSIFLQNSEAEKLRGLIERVESFDQEREIAHGERFFLLKSNRSGDKTIISATDITEQKRKERLASMGQMAAHLAHEIRNPIGSIALLLSTLSKRVVPQNQPIVEEIRRALFRVERIIKSTLLYSKGVHPRPVRFNLTALKSECEAAVKSYSYTKAIDFHFHFPDQMVQADPNLLALALQNLLFNAIDAIEEDENEEGRVSLHCEINKNDIRFSVSDSGIPFAQPDRLFEAFFTTKTKGHGLGLVLTRQIAEAHGGSVAVKTKPKQILFIIPRH